MNNIFSRIPEKEKRRAIPKQKMSAVKAPALSVLIIALMILLAFGSIALFRGGIGVAASALMNSYDAAYASEKDSAYQNWYNLAYNRAMKNYHVSSTVVISIGDLEETQKLEILKVNDVEIITEDRENNSGNITAWLEAEGEGTFVVDLQAAEFLVDNGRHYVLVRIPKPELTNITIIKTDKVLFADDWKDGSYKEGVELGLKQRNEASIRIEKALLSNQYIFSNACDVAVRVIGNLVKQFNPDIPDLTVDVEFME